MKAAAKTVRPVAQACPVEVGCDMRPSSIGLMSRTMARDAARAGATRRSHGLPDVLRAGSVRAQRLLTHTSCVGIKTDAPGPSRRGVVVDPSLPHEGRGPVVLDQPGNWPTRVTSLAMSFRV